MRPNELKPYNTTSPIEPKVARVECLLGNENSGTMALSHLSIASFLWVIGKQCRPRSDATESGV